MSDRNESKGKKDQEGTEDTQVVPGASSSEPTVTPNTPPLPADSGSSEADPAGMSNTTDSLPND